MGKHTEGPWKHSWQPRLSVIHGPNGEHIADTGAWRDDEHPEMRANGDLIAAAPDLLEALEDAHEAIEACLHAEQNPRNERIEAIAGETVWKARRSKRDAIAKAKGEGQ